MESFQKLPYVKYDDAGGNYARENCAGGQELLEKPIFHRPCVPACQHVCASLSQLMIEDARYLYEHRSPDAYCVIASEANPKERLRKQRRPALVKGHGTCLWCRSDEGLVAKNGATHQWSEVSCPEYQASVTYLRERPSKKSYTYSVFVFRSPGKVVCLRKFREVFTLSRKEVETIQKHARRDMLAMRKSEQGKELSNHEGSGPMNKQVSEKEMPICSVVSSISRKESTANRQSCQVAREGYIGADENSPPGSQSSVCTVSSQVVRTQLVQHFLWEEVVCHKVVKAIPYL